MSCTWPGSCLALGYAAMPQLTSLMVESDLAQNRASGIARRLQPAADHGGSAVPALWHSVVRCSTLLFRHLQTVSCAMQAVGTRACYLFSRLVKTLRQNMRPLLSDILLRLQPHLAHILANPLPEAEPAAKGAEAVSSSFRRNLMLNSALSRTPLLATVDERAKLEGQAFPLSVQQCTACSHLGWGSHARQRGIL